MAKKNWIAGAIKHPGALRKTLGAKEGKPIPAAKLHKAAEGNSTTAHRARLALTLRKMHEGGVVPETGPYELEKGENVTAKKTGSQFNHNEKLSEHQESTLPTRQKFDGSDEPKADPKGGNCVCISPDGLVKRDGKKRFAY